MEDRLAAESDRKISMSPRTFSYLAASQVTQVRTDLCAAALTLHSHAMRGGDVCCPAPWSALTDVHAGLQQRAANL